MNPPAFQFYADDFIGGTITMTHAERGLYILLLCLQWTQGGITEDDIERLANGTAIAPLLRSKFVKCEDGKLRNRRLEQVRAEQIEFRNKQSVNGRSGAEKRWHRHSDANGTAIATPKPNDSSPSPSPSPLSLPPQGVKMDRDPKTMKKPTLDELKLCFAKAGGSSDDAEQFFNHYESNGWRVGRNPMRSWPHAVANWLKNKRAKTYENHGKPNGHRLDRNEGTFNAGGLTAEEADFFERKGRGLC